MVKKECFDLALIIGSLFGLKLHSHNDPWDTPTSNTRIASLATPTN